MKAKILLAQHDTAKFSLLKGGLIANIFINKRLDLSIVEHKENGQIPYRGNPNQWVVTGDTSDARKHYKSLTGQGYKDQNCENAFSLGYDAGWYKQNREAAFSIPLYCRAYEKGYKEGAQDVKEHAACEIHDYKRAQELYEG